ncbi:uncharacterized protein LOC142615980 [Castanea sativa]|uniref:uncharacterized protein LOC142615980 n=1 Tax=Castanea sativa TaxID=21020 RepID=UPI003F650B6F
MGSQHEDHFLHLEREKDREGNVHTTHTSRSHSRGGSRISHEENARVMQLEIDRLMRKLRHERRRGTPFFSDPSSEDTKDSSYRPRSRTPPSKSFSYEKDNLHGHRSRNSSCRGLENDAMSKVLNQISKSPFTRRVEGGKLPWRFTQPTFTINNGRTDPVELVSHFNQRMEVHSKNETLMCKVFPSSLGPVAMRWFNGLRADSINSFMELTQACRSRFITCSRVPRPLDSLLSMAMQEGETLKTYSDRYWEMFNEIDGDFDDVAIRTFKVSLPVKHDLRKSLTKKPIRSVHRLMDRIDEYKRVEEDQEQSKGKAKRDHSGSVNQGNTSSMPPLGTINIIFAVSGRIGSRPSWVVSIARTLAEDSNSEPKRAKGNIQPALSFSEEDKIGTTQPHDDALVVTLRIGGMA